MTYKEILESTVNMSEACITERQKQGLYKILLNTEKLAHLEMKLDYDQIWK